MRAFLFNLTGKIFAAHIQFVQWSSAEMLKILGNVGYFFLKRIDPKRLGVYEQAFLPEEPAGANELASQGLELRLLASANQVRDHARETDDWTDRHTEALNAIGDALMVEAGWEEDAVHQYLKGLVESIEGLEYGTED